MYVKVPYDKEFMKSSTSYGEEDGEFLKEDRYRSHDGGAPWRLR